MKYNLKSFIKIKALIVLLLFVSSCSDSDKTIDKIFEQVENGAILRTIKTDGSLDINNLNSVWSTKVEAQDNKNGALLKEVKFYASYKFIDDKGEEKKSEKVLLKTIPASDFQKGDKGLPVTTISATFSETLDALGLNVADYGCGKEIIYDMDMVLTDGRVFNNDNAGNIITGGFFNSPFQYNVTIKELFDQPDFFTGDYEIEQLTGSLPSLGGLTFQKQTVELKASKPTQRKFDFKYYRKNEKGENDVTDYSFTMDFVCDYIKMKGVPNLGRDENGAIITYGCGDGSIEQTQSSTKTFFDTNYTDDDEIILNIKDFAKNGGCGISPNEITVKLTKIN